MIGSYLRKKRKWPHMPYKGRWQQTFDEQQAMASLKKAAESEEHNPKNHLLSSLINSFQLYGCDPNPSGYALVIKTLTLRALFSELPPVLDRLEKIEKFDTPERILTDLIRSYGDAGMLQEAIDTFYRIPKFRCSPSVYSLNNLLSILCKKKESLVLVYDVLMRSFEMKIRLEDSSFLVLIKALCKYGKTNSAITILNLMQHHGLMPDSRIYSAALLSLCKHGGCVEILSFLEEIKKAGFSPTESDYIAVVTSLVKKRGAKDAYNVLNQMKMEGLKPDIVCYTSVLNGLLSMGDFQKGEEVFDELLVMGLVPDAFTCYVYINGLCKQNNLEYALQMLTSMEEVGCRPDVVAYNVVISAFCKVGDVGKAREIIERMHTKGVKGNLVTYRILLDGFLSSGDMDTASALLVEMFNSGFIPGPSMVSSVICALCECQFFYKALTVVEEMFKCGIGPEAKAWEALLTASLFNHSQTKTLLVLEGLTKQLAR